MDQDALALAPCAWPEREPPAAASVDIVVRNMARKRRPRPVRTTVQDLIYGYGLLVWSAVVTLAAITFAFPKGSAISGWPAWATLLAVLAIGWTLLILFDVFKRSPPHALWGLAGIAILPVLLAWKGGNWLRRRAKTQRYLRLLGRSDLATMDLLDGVSFEVRLAKLFHDLGYHVTMTPGSHDFGADLVGERRGERIVVQAKRLGAQVGIAAVQEVAGARMHYRATRAIVVTNQTFTASARELAISNGVELWDRYRLAEMLGEAAAPEPETVLPMLTEGDPAQSHAP